MKKTRVLFIGNSFTHRNDLPGMLSQLARSATPPRDVETQRIIFNGMSLRAHWNRGDARKAIAKSAWDYVVLQEQSTLPLKNPARMHESVALFDEVIKAHGAKTMLYLTWARQNVFDRQDELTEAYRSIGRKLKAIVVPVGVAWQRVLTEHPDIVLHDKDKSHPNALGSYLAACVFYAALFKKTPVGLWSMPSVAPETVKLLQATAWRTCT